MNGFEIGDFVEEVSQFTEGMEFKPQGIIVGFVKIIDKYLAQVQILNDDHDTIIPLYLNEIRKT